MEGGRGEEGERERERGRGREGEREIDRERETERETPYPAIPYPELSGVWAHAGGRGLMRELWDLWEVEMR
jgi:hypothetical protein